MAEKHIDGYIRESLDRGGLDKGSAVRVKNACKEFENKNKRTMSEKEFLTFKMNIQAAAKEKHRSR